MPARPADLPTLSCLCPQVSSLYHKLTHDYAEFYKASLMYLAFVATEELEPAFRLALVGGASTLVWG